MCKRSRQVGGYLTIFKVGISCYVQIHHTSSRFVAGNVQTHGAWFLRCWGLLGHLDPSSISTRERVSTLQDQSAQEQHCPKDLIVEPLSSR